MDLSYFKTETGIIIIVAILFVLSQLVFFPGIYTSSDEHHFLANTMQIQRGYLGEENPENVCSASSYGETGYMYGQYIGRSLFTIPFSWLGFNAVMFSGTIIHLLNLAILVLILRKLKIREILALPYLFYPVIFWQSRTLYAGILVLTFFLSAFYFYTSKKEKHFVLSGFLLGLAMIARYDAALGIAAFLLVPLLKDRRKLLFILAGFLPVLLAIVSFNYFTYGGLLSTGYYSSGGGSTTGAFFLIETLGLFYNSLFNGSFLTYVGLLLAVYPLLLASPYISKFPYKKEFALFSIAYLILAARYPILAFDNSIFTILLRMRYALPLTGMLFIPYAFALNSLFAKFKEKEKLLNSAFIFVVVILFGGGLLASSVHGSFVSGRKTVSNQLYENTPDDSLIIGSSDDCIYFLNGFFKERNYLSVDLESQLAGNPEELKLEDFLGENTYIMDLRYGNRQGNDSIRQDTINEERKKMEDFISKNKNRLELVFESNSPHSLKLYRWAE